jgi:hypothetical protein
MRLVRLLTSRTSRLTTPLLISFQTLVFGVAFVAQGNAGLINPNLGSFVLNNTSADGSVMIKSPSSFVLTGGNTGSGIPGSTDFSVISSSAGMLQFQYSYASLDFPGFDVAGYLLGNSRMPLADTDGEAWDMACVISVPVTVGEKYGW